MNLNNSDQQEWVAVTRVRRGSAAVQSVALIGRSEREGLDTLATVQIAYDARPDGLPTQAGFKLTEEFEDQAVPLLEGAGAIYVGRIKVDGVSTLYFYGPAEGLPKEITVSKQSWFSKKREAHTVESRPDPMWTFYEQELKPTPLEYEIARSRPLHKALGDHGDRHSTPRPVDFTFLFPSEEGRAAFLSEMAERQVFLNGEGAWENFEGNGWPYWCSLVLTTPVDPPTIGQICADFRALARSHEGDLDGWACPVAN